MIWLHFPALLGFVSLLHLVLTVLIFLCFSLIIFLNLPLGLTKTFMLLLKSAAAVWICQLLISLQFHFLPAALATLVLFAGQEIEVHLKKRTTAAYSTSDSQNQRFFNITLYVLFLSILAAVLSSFTGKTIVSAEFTNWISAKISTAVIQILCCAGLGLFLRHLLTLYQNGRTVLYVLGSHLNSLLKGKLKRKW